MSVDYQEVARVASRAIAADRSAVDAVAAHYGITYNAATHRLAKARRLGHDIPKFRGDRAGRRWMMNAEGFKAWGDA